MSRYPKTLLVLVCFLLLAMFFLAKRSRPLTYAQKLSAEEQTRPIELSPLAEGFQLLIQGVDAMSECPQVESNCVFPATAFTDHVDPDDDNWNFIIAPRLPSQGVDGFEFLDYGSDEWGTDLIRKTGLGGTYAYNFNWKLSLPPGEYRARYYLRKAIAPLDYEQGKHPELHWLGEGCLKVVAGKNPGETHAPLSRPECLIRNQHFEEFNE